MLFDQKELEIAGQTGGLYLDSIGKTDLAKLTKDEWLHFLLVTCREYRLRFDESQLERGDPPF